MKPVRSAVTIASLRFGVLIVPPPVYERSREAVRAAPLVRARGRLERREEVVNILVAELEALEWNERSGAEVRGIEKTGKDCEVSVGGAADDLGVRRRARELAVAELRAVVPAGYSFGRRGR